MVAIPVDMKCYLLWFWLTFPWWLIMLDIFPLAVYMSSAEIYLFTPFVHFLNWVIWLFLSLSCYPRTFERMNYREKGLELRLAHIKHTNDEIWNRRYQNGHLQEGKRCFMKLSFHSHKALWNGSHVIALLCFLTALRSMWNIVPWAGIEPMPPAVGPRSPNLWTTREASDWCFSYCGLHSEKFRFC